MEKALSDSDIRKHVKNVIVYNQLKGMKPEEFIKMLPVAILYQVTPTFGHWTLLLKTPSKSGTLDEVEFFDSYGYAPDMEFKYLDYKQPHYLAKLLRKLSDITQVNYSPYKFQSTKSGINTCGRWVILRYLLRNMDINTFAERVFKISKKLSVKPDKLVTLATKSS
jgi:hypothetical protein